MNSEKIDQLLNWINDLSDKTEAEVEELRVKLLGKKGEITQLFDEFRTTIAYKRSSTWLVD